MSFTACSCQDHMDGQSPQYLPGSASASSFHPGYFANTILHNNIYSLICTLCRQTHTDKKLPCLIIIQKVQSASGYSFFKRSMTIAARSFFRIISPLPKLFSLYLYELLISISHNVLYKIKFPVFLLLFYKQYGLYYQFALLKIRLTPPLEVPVYQSL